jgi:hypothetical protein
MCLMKAHAMEPHQGTGAGQAIEVGLHELKNLLYQDLHILVRMHIFSRPYLDSGARP